MSELKHYEPPAITHELKLETRAGSPVRVGNDATPEQVLKASREAARIAGHEPPIAAGKKADGSHTVTGSSGATSTYKGYEE